MAYFDTNSDQLKTRRLAGMSEELEKQKQQIPDKERRQIIKKLSFAIAVAAPSARTILGNGQQVDPEGS